MIERFLRYSVEHGKPVRAVLLLDGQPVQHTIRVLLLRDGVATVLSGRGKKEIAVPMENFLSVGYARGDDGGA